MYSGLKLHRVGEKWETNSCGSIIIIEYINARNCDIKFNDGTVVKGVIYANIKKGTISNPNAPTAYGVGFMGQGKYSSKTNGKITKVYDTWIGMLRRCYSENFHKKQSTYIGCSVAEEWHNFQVFAEWFENNYIEGFQLDKDILQKGNKIYSSETCCFIPSEINSLFLSCKSKRGGCPIGVSKDNKKFKSSIRIKGKQVTLDRFNTSKEAFEIYKEAKECEIKRIAVEYYSTGKISLKIYQAMYNYKVEITD